MADIPEAGTPVRAKEDIPLDWEDLREPDILEGPLEVKQVGTAYTRYSIGGVGILPETIELLDG